MPAPAIQSKLSKFVSWQLDAFAWKIDAISIGLGISIFMLSHALCRACRIRLRECS